MVNYKISNNIKRITKDLAVGGVICAGFIATAVAGPPIPFDGFTTNSGAITATACPSAAAAGFLSGATITCGTLTDPSTVVSEGMLQRQVTVSGASGSEAVQNGTYIQFIITDMGVTGDAAAAPFSAARGNLNFTNEDFVKMNNRSSGISEKQVIIDCTFNGNIEDRFVNTLEYEFGNWARTDSYNFPWVKLNQDISQLDYSNNPLNPTRIFDSAADILSDGVLFNDDLKVTLTQDVDLTDPNPVNGSGAQGFKYVKVRGKYIVGSNPTDPMLPGGTNGGTVKWNPGDKEVTATWIGQTLDNGGPGGGVADFGFTKYTSITRIPPFFGTLTPMSSSLTSFLDGSASTTAVNWNLLAGDPANFAMFGAVPTVPAVPVLVAPTFAAPAPNPMAATVPAGSPPGGPTTPVALPLPYFGWTVSGGVFTLDPCPVGVICGLPIVNEGGMMQRVIDVGGVEYIQTIVADKNATGDPNAAEFTASSLAFKSENFVKLRTVGIGGQGIASVLHIAEQDLAYVGTGTGLNGQAPLPSTGGQFVYNTALKTGWANGGPLDPRIAVDQRLVVPDGGTSPDLNTSSVDIDFHMKAGATEADQEISISDAVGTGNTGNGFGNPIRFATDIVKGAFQNTTHLLTDPALLPSTGGNIAWAPGEAVQVTWVGGEYVTSDPFATARIGTTTFSNLSTGARTEATRGTPDGTKAGEKPNPAPPVDAEGWGSISPVDPFGPPPATYSITYTPPGF